MQKHGTGLNHRTSVERLPYEKTGTFHSFAFFFWLQAGSKLYECARIFLGLLVFFVQDGAGWFLL